jgi:hypothetical protein
MTISLVGKILFFLSQRTLGGFKTLQGTVQKAEGGTQRPNSHLFPAIYWLMEAPMNAFFE